MRDQIIGLLPMIDQSLAAAVGVIDQSALGPVANMRNRLAARLAYPDDVLLAALAGGTGSGKSSLFNAIAGEDLASTGGVRPTTSHPQALVPTSRASALAGYLDQIGIEDRVLHDGQDWLCLIDLPDTDSVELDHRQRVDSLLPQIDCVIWVVDPEKYRDAALHHGYLAPMAAYQRQFVFVLNQRDRIEEGDVDRVKDDLIEALREDGIEDPTVLDTAAQPSAGPPSGIDALLDHLREECGRSVFQKLLVDLRTGCASLLEAPGGGPGVDFDKRWSRALDDAQEQAAGGDLSGAGQQVAAFLEGIADETGGELGTAIEEIAVRASLVVIDVGSRVPSAGRQEPKRRWWPNKAAERPGPKPDFGPVRASLESEIGEPVRALLTKRAKAHASIAELALALDAVTRRSDR
jgi:hypothetical protein